MTILRLDFVGFQQFRFLDSRSQEIELHIIATPEITKNKKPKSVVRRV
jgi:hypothetical protein